MRAHRNFSYFSNFITRGAGSVVVSASDWHAGGPDLIPGRCKPVLFGIKTNRQRLALLNCAAGGAMLCATHILACLLHKAYPIVAQAAISLYNGRPMCVYRGDKYANASLHRGGKKEKTKESGTPFRLDQRRRHLEI